MQTSSDFYLALLAEQERVRGNHVAGVRTVLVVLSAAAMVSDTDALRHKVLSAYPDAAVFFATTQGKPLGAPAPQTVDLMIDMTGPGQRQGIFFAKKLRRMARVAIGRNAGLFRKRIYDRVCDEKQKQAQLPRETLAREREVQRQVLALAGVASVPSADAGPDRGQTIALELPPMAKL